MKNYQILLGGVVITSIAALIIQFSSPKFKVGDCVNYISDAEPWERTEPTTQRIEEVGKRSYRVSLWADGFWYGQTISSSESFTISITNEDLYEKVNCPTEVK